MHEKQDQVEIAITYLGHHGGLPPIEKMTDGSSGFDIVASCGDAIVIPPGRASLIPSGFILSIPRGFEAQVRPRSGLALNQRIGLLNSPGTIDSDYRGEVGVIMFNFSDEDFIVRRGDRIAQLVFCPVPGIRLVVKEELDDTARGPGGFGHTG